MQHKKQQRVLQRKIGQRIKEARVGAGLSQQALAARLKMTGSGLGYIESGQRRIDLFTLERIANATRKPLDYFFEQKKFAVESKLLEMERQMKELKKLLTASRKSGGGGEIDDHIFYPRAL